MDKVKEFDRYAFRQEGRRILIDSYMFRGSFYPKIILFINDDGSVDFCSEWVALRKKKAEHRGKWNSFVEALDLGSNVALKRAMREAAPPMFVDPQEFREYAIAVALGEIKVHHVGKKGKRLIQTALDLAPVD